MVERRYMLEERFKVNGQNWQFYFHRKCSNTVVVLVFIAVPLYHTTPCPPFAPLPQVVHWVLGLSMLERSIECTATMGEVKVACDVYGFKKDRCRGFMHNGCASNLKAMLRFLLGLFHNAVAVTSLSHCFNKMGGRLGARN